MYRLTAPNDRSAALDGVERHPDRLRRQGPSRSASQASNQLARTRHRTNLKGVSAEESTGEVSAILAAWRRGDQNALDRLVPLVYDELRHVAHNQLRRESPGHVLQTTALVHEAYLRLTAAGRVDLKDRSHFLAVSARLMRQILVDDARKRRATKRGGAAVTVAIAEDARIAPAPSLDILLLDLALTELASFDERLCQVVEVRFFAGLSIAETAQALGVGTATVERDWVAARAWLYQRLQNG